MSSSSIWDNLFDDDDDEHRFGGEDEREPPWMTKDAVVLLIDARAPMFVPSANGEVPFENAVKSAHLFYQDKIICSDWDLVRVALVPALRPVYANVSHGVYDR